MLNSTTVVNIKNDPYDLYIGRANPTYNLPASKWANPFKLEREADRSIVLARYRIWLLQQPSLMHALSELRGLRLACWCSPRACHGDVLADLVNSGAANAAQARPAGIVPTWEDTTRAYWAEEVRIGCEVSLERLAMICQQQGWDYAATVEAIR
jgi:hypothetical protein